MAITNRLFEEISIGDSAQVRRVCTENDLYIFAHASGSLNPLNLPDRDFDGNPDTPALAPAMWVGALVSQVIGNRLPGPGAEHRAQSFTFHGPVSVGDEVSIYARVVHTGRTSIRVHVEAWKRSRGQPEARYLRRNRRPVHAMSETDRLVARPADFAATQQAASATSCWQDWQRSVVTAHDGLVRPNHPALLAALERVQSASSLAKLLRNPLGFTWTYALGVRAPESAVEALVLADRRAFWTGGRFVL